MRLRVGLVRSLRGLRLSGWGRASISAMTKKYQVRPMTFLDNQPAPGRQDNAQRTRRAD